MSIIVRTAFSQPYHYHYKNHLKFNQKVLSFLIPFFFSNTSTNLFTYSSESFLIQFDNYLQPHIFYKHQYKIFCVPLLVTLFLLLSHVHLNNVMIIVYISPSICCLIISQSKIRRRSNTTIYRTTFILLKYLNNPYYKFINSIISISLYINTTTSIISHTKFY